MGKRRSQFIPYQQDWINDTSPLKLADKSRRTGLTFAEAYDATSTRFRRTSPRDMDYWLSSADESAGIEFIEYCSFWAKDLFGAIADYYVDHIEDPETKKIATAHCIRCPNGKRIVALTSNPRRFRSKGGDVCLDEIAFHDQPREMLKAAGPVTTWGGSLRLISTHNGEDSSFNQSVKRCRKLLTALGYDPNKPPRLAWKLIADAAERQRLMPVYSYHRITIEDAIAQGLLDKINAKRLDVGVDGVSREEFLRECRMKCADEAAFLEEYMCQPSTDASAWLTYALIESCEHEACAGVDEGLVGYQGGICDVGVDVGRTENLTVIWVLENVGDVRWTRQVTRIRDKELPEQQDILLGILRDIKWRRCCIDKTGIGLGLYEYSKKVLGDSRIEGVHFTGPAKEAIAVGMKQAFESREVRICANDASVRDGLHKVRKTVLPGGGLRFDAANTAAGHADEFWGLGLALYAGDSEPPINWSGAGLVERKFESM